MDDLGAESLDLIEISLDTEEEFGISLPEKNILETAEAIFGENVLEKEGILTEQGKKFLRRRMAENDGSSLEGEVTVEEIKRSFLRVGTWVRMIRGLIEYTPRVCRQCGAKLKEVQAGMMKCRECGAECEIPYGDDINKQWIQQYYENEYLPARTSSDAG